MVIIAHLRASNHHDDQYVTINGTIPIMSDSNEIRPRIISSADAKPTHAIKGRSVDDGGLMMIDSFMPSRAFIVSGMWGIIVAIVTFLACAALVVGMNEIGILGSINALLGEAMQLTVPMLMKMSVLFAIVVGVSVCLFNWFRLMIYNSISFLTGGLIMKMHMVDGVEDGDRK